MAPQSGQRGGAPLAIVYAGKTSCPLLATRPTRGVARGSGHGGDRAPSLARGTRTAGPAPLEGDADDLGSASAGVVRMPFTRRRPELRTQWRGLGCQDADGAACGTRCCFQAPARGRPVVRLGYLKPKWDGFRSCSRRALAWGREHGIDVSAPLAAVLDELGDLVPPATPSTASWSGVGHGSGRPQSGRTSPGFTPPVFAGHPLSIAGRSPAAAGIRPGSEAKFGLRGDVREPGQRILCL